MQGMQKEFGLLAPRVLVVEDESLLRVAMSEFLRGNGIIVIEAASAEEARSAIIAGRPVDLVFSDIQLPGSLDGIALAMELRELRPGLPVVLTSGYVVPPSGLAGVPFVRKPYIYRKVADLILQTLKLDPVLGEAPGSVPEEDHTEGPEPSTRSAVE